MLGAGIEGATAIADDHVSHAVRKHDVGARQTGGAGADDHNREVLGALVDDPERVEECRQHDDRRAVLVVVEDQDVKLCAQAAFDLEAARRRDVLQVDAAEGRGSRRNEGNDLTDVLGVEAQRERVDAGELLEQHRLALHDWHRRLGADVAEAEHGGAVGDDRDRVALDRQRPRLGRIIVDRHRDARHPGRVRHREIVAGLDRDFRVDLDFAPLCIKNVRSETLPTRTPFNSRNARTIASL